MYDAAAYTLCRRIIKYSGMNYTQYLILVISARCNNWIVIN